MGIQSIVGLSNLRAVKSRQQEPHKMPSTSLKKARDLITELEADWLIEDFNNPKKFAQAMIELFDAAERCGISARRIRECFQEEVYKK